MNNERPLVSFCIVTYNQEKYIREAIEGALNQTYSPMEIIISDDCSTDGTYEEILKTVEGYTGPHKIIVNKNEPNLGIREHMNKVMFTLSKGEYILLAGGDDVSAPERAETYVKYFEKFPQVMSISCLSEEVDENMQPINTSADWNGSYSIYNLDDYLNYRNFIIYSGDSRGLRRKVLEAFPPLECAPSEDIYMFVRSLLVGSGCYLRMPLVKRRNHTNNFSKRPMKKQDAFERQVNIDIDYAVKSGYISENKAIQLREKIHHVRDLFELYWGSPRSSFRSFFYRVLSKLFHVKKY